MQCCWVLLCGDFITMSKSLNRLPPGLVSKNREPLRPGDPRTVGPWKILSRIGAGGMGVVYYANRRGQ